MLLHAARTPRHRCCTRQLPESDACSRGCGCARRHDHAHMAASGDKARRGRQCKATARLRRFSMGVSAVQARGEAYERRSPPRMTALNEKEQEEGSLPGRLITGTNHTTVLRIVRVVPMIQQHRQSRYDMRANTCDDAQLQPAWPAGPRAPAWRARLVAAHALATDYYPFRAFRAFTSAD
jgi:hypothetical protein